MCPIGSLTFAEMVWFSLDPLSSRRRRGPLADGLHTKEENLSLLSVCMFVALLTTLARKALLAFHFNYQLNALQVGEKYLHRCNSGN